MIYKCRIMERRDTTNIKVHPVMAVTTIEMLSKHLLPVELTILGKYDKEEVSLRLSCNWEDTNAKTWLINKAAFLAQKRIEEYAPVAWDDIEDEYLAVLRDYIEKHPQCHSESF
mgnify:CR=1 FL=1